MMKVLVLLSNLINGGFGLYLYSQSRRLASPERQSIRLLLYVLLLTSLLTDAVYFFYYEEVPH